MANKIQIKRSTTTAAPTGLANGELAYTSNGEILFVGHPDGVTGSVAISGKRFPGVLTANQALVANSSSLLDKIWLTTEVLVGANVDLTTSALLIGNSTVNSTVNSTFVQVASGSGIANLTSTNLVIGGTTLAGTLLTLGGQVNANGGVGTAGQVLTSGAAGNVYWSSITGATNLTDSSNATTVTILSDTGTDAVLDSANATNAGILTSADWTKLNNMPANSVAGANSQIMFNANGVLAGDDGLTYNGVSNTLTVQNISVSGTATLNIDSISVGNSTVNTSLIPTLIQAANSTGTSNLTPTTLTIGTSVVNSSAVAAGSNAYVNTTALFISSNSTVNATATATLLQVSNSTSTSNLTATQLNIGANVFANTSAFDVGNTIITSALLTLGGQVNANGGVGSAGQVLTSGAAGNAYWTTPAAGVAGSNSQVQFNANGVLSGDAGFVFDGVADALIVGGAAQTTSPTFRVANSTTSANLSSAALNVGTAYVNSSAVGASTNSYMNVTSVFISTNSTINATHTAALFQVANSTATANLTATNLLIASNSTVNASITSALVQVSNSTATANLTATQLSVGANVFANTSAFVANSATANAILSSTNLSISTNATSTTLFSGNSTVNSVVSPVLLQVASGSGVANLTATQLSIGANVFANSSAFDVGNTIITSALLTLGGQINANGGVGSAGQVLVSGGAGNVYWTNDTNTTYDLVTIANTTVGVVALDPSTGANDDVRFVGANGIIVTSDAVGNVIISTNSGGNGTFNNLIVSGNLTVSGTFTQFDVETLTVEDPLIELSRTQANTATFLDAIDIGFYGQYGNTSNVVYTGLFRDASATDKTFRLFSGQIPAPGATVDTSNVNFGYANLIIHSLNGGNTNSTIDLFIIDGGTF